MVVDKDVCDKWCVTKMCVRDCVTKMVVDKEEERVRRSGRRRSGRDTESKTRTPHKDVGKNIRLIRCLLASNTHKGAVNGSSSGQPYFFLGDTNWDVPSQMPQSSHEFLWALDDESCCNPRLQDIDRSSETM